MSPPVPQVGVHVDALVRLAEARQHTTLSRRAQTAADDAEQV